MRRQHENRYCHNCQKTINHNAVAEALACQRCGSLKYPTPMFCARPGQVGQKPTLIIG
jgi:hypothetical protein